MTSKTHLIQIVPNVPPSVCGVGDHARFLGNAIELRYGIESTYVSTNSKKFEHASEMNVEFLADRTSVELANNLLQIVKKHPSSVILLHFSGYSYARRGLCFWIAKGLKSFRNLRPEISVITMFHELWAGGSWLSSAVYVQPLQRMIVRELVGVSQAIHTNRVEYERKIRRIDQQKTITALPVFSNFGEPDRMMDWEERRSQLVLFQPPPGEGKEGASFWSQLDMVQKKLGISKTIVAGRTRQLPQGFNFDVRGILSESDASSLLLESRYCYFQYYDGYLGKSSLLAALAAHGITCIMPSKNNSEEEGIYCGQHYLSAGDKIAWTDRHYLEAASKLHSWYQSHSISSTADKYAESIFHLSNRPAK